MKASKPRMTNTNWDLFIELCQGSYPKAPSDAEVRHVCISAAMSSAVELASEEPSSLIKLPYCGLSKSLRKLANSARKAARKGKDEAKVAARARKLSATKHGELSIVFGRQFRLACLSLEEALESSMSREAKLLKIDSVHMKACKWLHNSFWLKQAEGLSQRQRKQLNAFRLGKVKRELVSLFQTRSQADTSILYVPSTDSTGMVPVLGECNTLPLLASHLSAIAKNDTPLREGYRARFIEPIARAPPSTPPTLSLADLQSQLKGMKSNTPGPSGISVKMLKKLPERMLDEYFLSLLALWESRSAINFLKRKQIILLPKKPEPTIQDFRPIALLETGRKILLGALIRKYDPSELSPYQFGFRAGKSTDEACKELHATLILADRTREPLILCSLDFSKAFDSLPWDFLVSSLEKVGIHQDVTNFIVDHEREGLAFLSRDVWYSCEAGVPQGSVEGPIFWNAFLNPLLLKLDSICAEYPEEFHRSAHISFADDVTLIARTRTGLDRLLAEVKCFVEYSGMKLSVNKCFTSRNRYFRENDVVDRFGRKGSEPIFILGRSFRMDPLLPRKKFTALHPKAKGKLEAAMEKLDRLNRRSISAEVAQQAVSMVLLPQLAYLLKFEKDAEEHISKFDTKYRRLIKKKLHLARTFPNTLVDFPLGSARYGSKPLFPYILTSRLATLHRLSWSCANVEEELRVRAIDHHVGLSCFTSPKGHLHDPRYAYRGWDKLDDIVNDFPAAFLENRNNLSCSGYIREEEGEKTVTLVFSNPSNQIAAIKGTIPWPLDVSDKLRCELSALVICARFNSIRLMRHRSPKYNEAGALIGYSYPFAPIVFKTRRIDPAATVTPRVFKRMRSLAVRNSDLIGEIASLARCPYIERVKKVNRLVSFTEANANMRVSPLTCPHVLHGHTKNKIKENIAEAEFFHYLIDRQTLHDHNGPYDWTRLPTYWLRLAWLTGKLRSITHLKVLFDHAPYGGLLLRRKFKFQPVFPKTTLRDKLLEADAEQEEGILISAPSSAPLNSHPGTHSRELPTSPPVDAPPPSSGAAHIEPSPMIPESVSKPLVFLLPRRRFSKTCFTHCLYCCIDIAIRFYQCFFAFHHA
jgi:hypothetical protein